MERAEEGREEGREREERAAAAQGEVLAATESIHSFCASTGTKMELSAAYLKSEGEGFFLKLNMNKMVSTYGCSWLAIW